MHVITNPTFHNHAQIQEILDLTTSYNSILSYHQYFNPKSRVFFLYLKNLDLTIISSNLFLFYCWDAQFTCQIANYISVEISPNLNASPTLQLCEPIPIRVFTTCVMKSATSSHFSLSLLQKTQPWSIEESCTRLPIESNTVLSISNSKVDKSVSNCTARAK